ncbi:TetR/AcrR family transcriptional regulator [Glaciimonas sp. GNP009]
MKKDDINQAPVLKFIKQDRKKDILLSAEKLFAMRSYDGVSIRDIADDAGVPSRLVGYYFDKKDNLFEAIFEHRKPNIDERLNLLKEAKAHIDAPDALEKIVHAWCAPVVQMRAHPDGENFLILVARTVWEQSEIAVRVIQRYYDPLARDFIDALQVLFPDRDESSLYWAYEWALGALLMHIADKRVERLSKGVCKAGGVDRGPDLVAFICGGIRAMPAQPKKKSAKSSVASRVAVNPRQVSKKKTS